MSSGSTKIQEYLNKIKDVQSTLLEFLDQESNAEESYQNLCALLNSFIIHNKNELRLFLHLISKIIKNYHDGPDFISKINRIIEYLEESMKKYLSNSEIFNFFKNNKRILLFLVEKKIIIFNEDIIKKIIQPKCLEAKYPQYFQPEIKPFMNEEWFPKYETESNKSGSSSTANNNSTMNKAAFGFSSGSFSFNNNLAMNKAAFGFSSGPSIFNYNSIKNKWIKELEKELPDDFNEMRKSGENENYICKLIRNDSVEEFIAYVNKNNYPLISTIKSSIFETNSFLIKKQIESDKSNNNNNRSSFGNGNSSQNNKDDKLTLIKYAAFFGSIQIFKYLQINRVELTPQLWYFAIHGKNAEIIHLLEDNHIEFENLYEECFKEATKCHHNEIANYFLNNFLQNNGNNSKDIYLFIQGLKYYNFSFLPNELINENSFLYMCQFDYYYFTNIIPLNKTSIQKEKKEADNY